MRKLLSVAAMSACLLSTTVNANDAVFEGPYVGGSLNYSTLDISAQGKTYNGDSEIGGALQAGYDFDFDNEFTLGLEVSISQKDGKINILNFTEVTVDRSVYFSVLPGYKLNKSTVVYARLSKGNGDFTFTTISTGAKIYENGDMTGFGFGVKSMLMESVSMNLEYSLYSASERFGGVAADYSVDVLSAGVKYHF